MKLANPGMMSMLIVICLLGFLTSLGLGIHIITFLKEAQIARLAQAKNRLVLQELLIIGSVYGKKHRAIANQHITLACPAIAPNQDGTIQVTNRQDGAFIQAKLYQKNIQISTGSCNLAYKKSSTGEMLVYITDWKAPL